MSDPFPPPPGNLSPPPGYVGYQPSPIGSVPLRRVGAQCKALTVLLGIYAVVAVLAAVLAYAVVGAAEDYLDGQITDDELTDELGPVLGVGLVQAGLGIAIAVVTMVWMYKVAANHRALLRRTTWAPGWAIGGWFLPPVIFVIPFLMLLEMWKAAEPTSPPGDDGWRRSPVDPVVPIWWALYGPLAFVLVFVGTNPVESFGGDVDDAAERLADTRMAALLQAGVNVAAALAFLLLVRRLTARHTRLTGEASRP